MAETAATAQKSRRSTKIGLVVSTKMQKTIVVEVTMRKSHALYRRVVSHSKKFYAHDENNTDGHEPDPLADASGWWRAGIQIESGR